jgi:hypothetical protein
LSVDPVEPYTASRDGTELFLSFLRFSRSAFFSVDSQSVRFRTSDLLGALKEAMLRDKLGLVVVGKASMQVRYDRLIIRADYMLQTNSVFGFPETSNPFPTISRDL